jgi:hypothetical protein
MKKLIFIVFTVFTVFISCNKNNSHKSSIQGYFFNNSKFEFYEFKSNIIHIYNFNDSTLTKKRYKLYNDNLEIDGFNYDYIDYNGDSLCIKKIIDKDRDLIISKFTYEKVEFNLNEIQWFKINKKRNTFSDSIGIRIKENEIITLTKGKNDSQTRSVGYSLSMGLFFNKFPIYTNAIGISSIVNISNDTLAVISGNDSYCEEILFKKGNESKPDGADMITQ